MDIKAIKLKEFLKSSESIYKNIIITATRARQIIDDRFQDAQGNNLYQGPFSNMYSVFK